MHDITPLFVPISYGLTENARHEIAGHENTGHEFARHDQYCMKIDYITFECAFLLNLYVRRVC